MRDSTSSPVVKSTFLHRDILCVCLSVCVSTCMFTSPLHSLVQWMVDDTASSEGDWAKDPFAHLAQASYAIRSNNKLGL